MTNSTLAIDGGTPALKKTEFPWPIASPSVCAAVSEAMHDGSWGQYEGPWTEQLIEKLQTEFQTAQVLLCSSGTIAVELALRGAGVRAEDEVILAGYDFPGNFRAVESIGARPVLVDVIENGWVLCPQQVESALSDRTSAVIVSHLHGQTADLAGIRSVIESGKTKLGRNIAIVEDACQVPGGRLDERPLGGLGDVAAISFGGSKLLSAGRGGAILAHDEAILQRAKIYGQRGNDAFPLSQLQAAVLCPQLDALGPLTEQRHLNALRLINALKNDPALEGLQQFVANSQPAYFKLPWLLRDRATEWSRSDFIHALKGEGVPVGEGFRGFLRRSPRRCRKLGSLANSRIAAQQTILLHHPVLLETSETMDTIVEAFEKVIAHSTK